jgi:chromate transporter
MSEAEADARVASRPSLAAVVREWGRIGCIGFGGPPTHIKMLRDLCVQRERWLTAVEFEDAVALCNLLPGPASTQLAIFSRGVSVAASAPCWAGPRLSSPA